MNRHNSRRAASLACMAFLALCATAAHGQGLQEAAAATEANPALGVALPPIESIGAGSDIRAFLAPGVPAELTRAALRRAWMVDPAIDDFVGLSENPEDFSRRPAENLGSEPPISRLGSVQGSGSR
jgi:Protein of unknown function (DUF3306)